MVPPDCSRTSAPVTGSPLFPISPPLILEGSPPNVIAVPADRTKLEQCPKFTTNAVVGDSFNPLGESMGASTGASTADCAAAASAASCASSSAARCALSNASCTAASSAAASSAVSGASFAGSARPWAGDITGPLVKGCDEDPPCAYSGVLKELVEIVEPPRRAGETLLLASSAMTS